jgi:2-polyprenyl-6-methoxyphenol hydroxylase-like FAD-dependent oxidoreductase
VGAPAYHEVPPRSIAYYTYWEGVPIEGGEMYGRPRRMIGAWPTNDGLVMTYVAWPAAEFHAFRADVERNFLETLDLAGDLGERVRGGRQAERFLGTADLPNRFRVPAGPGWALVGDAGLVMDPLTGQGIADALRDAELLADAVARGLDAGGSLEPALAGYRAERDRAALAMYRFTVDLASFAPPRVEQELLMRAIAGRQEEVDRFLGVLTGVVPLGDYFAPPNMLRLLGARGLARVLLGKLRPPRGAAGAPAAGGRVATSSAR